MPHELIPYGGWQKVLRLKNAEVDLLLTTETGPRIIRFGFLNGPNEFVEYPEQMGRSGGPEYRSYGGHRLWVAPEEAGRTNHPDNNPVGWKEENGEATLIAPVEAGTRLQKQIRVHLEAGHNHVHVVHRITNRGTAAETLAPWALSVMAPGGRVIVPQEPFIPHKDRALPIRSLALWGYTQMGDARWGWGSKYIQLRQDPLASSFQKFGTLVTQGWAAYVNADRVFLKRFPYDPHAAYPDFGCNAEFFTNQKMLEVESLGPLVTLKPGESVTHSEEWYLFRGVQVGTTDDAIERSLAPLLNAAGL